MTSIKRVALLGSTGSIGTQTLDVIRQHPENFSVEVLTAQNNADLLIQQALEFIPNAVVIGNEARKPWLQRQSKSLQVRKQSLKWWKWRPLIWY